MKKLFPLLLTLILLVSMSTNIFATQTESAVRNDSADVEAVYAPGQTAGNVISVDIKWDGMQFTYNGPKDPVWDPVTHQYSEAQPGGWEAGEGTIRITNHSNVILQAGIAYTKGTNYGNVDMLFTGKQPYIGSAYTETTGSGAPCTVTVKAIPKGQLNDTVTTATKIGQIKVSVTPVTDSTMIPDDILEELSNTQIKTDNQVLDRGTVYFASEADANLVVEAYGSVDSSSTAAYNKTLNAFLTIYYDQLQIAQ